MICERQLSSWDSRSGGFRVLNALRLQHTDSGTHDQRGQQQRAAKVQRGQQTHLAVVQQEFFVHRIPDTKPVISKPQPSIKTKTANLNGSEITTGGSIIMPMPNKTLATTMSTTRKGM